MQEKTPAEGYLKDQDLSRFSSHGAFVKWVLDWEIGWLGWGNLRRRQIGC